MQRKHPGLVSNFQGKLPAICSERARHGRRPEGIQLLTDPLGFDERIALCS